MSPVAGNTVNYDTPAEMSPRDMAIGSIDQRIAAAYAAGRPNDDQTRTLMSRLHDDAVGVFEDAVKRLGEAQAVADATSGAIGLPIDPRARQAEIERRRRENDAAAQMQMGQGEQYAILEGRMQTGVHEQPTDLTRPETVPGGRSGHGANINRQINEVRMGTVDMRSGERFDRPQQNLMAQQQSPGAGVRKEATQSELERNRDLLSRTKDVQANRRA